MLAELERRDDTCASLWYLRDAQGVPRAGSRVVDHLRSRGPGAALERIGAKTLASKVKGRLLASWRRAAKPDTVVLDDGIGLRALQGWRPRKLVARINADRPTDFELESPPVTEADLVLLDPAAESDVSAGPVIESSCFVRDFEGALANTGERERQLARAALSISADDDLLVGWGEDGWLDGPDLFIRGLWMLEHYFGRCPRALWIASGASDALNRTLVAEARRCGLDNRFTISNDDRLVARLCGDAVFLPSRAAHDPLEMLTAVASGLHVITFPVHEVSDPGIRTVDHLDLEAAASVLNEALENKREQRAREAMLRLDVRPFVQAMLEATSD